MPPGYVKQGDVIWKVIRYDGVNAYGAPLFWFLDVHDREAKMSLFYCEPSTEAEYLAQKKD